MRLVVCGALALGGMSVKWAASMCCCCCVATGLKDDRERTCFLLVLFPRCHVEKRGGGRGERLCFCFCLFLPVGYSTYQKGFWRIVVVAGQGCWWWRGVVVVGI